MYYQDYEDYMKNVLGPRYTANYTNTGMDYQYNNYIPTYTMPINMPSTNYMQEYNSIPVVNNNTVGVQTADLDVSNNIKQTEDEAKIKKMYPEIYTLLTPMIEKTIAENKSKEITEELVETMTKQIYDAIEDDVSVRQVSSTQLASNDNKNRNSQSKPVINNTQIARRPGNPTLKDLIKILIINSIINNSRPNRPGGQRPPERPGTRPPVRPPMPRMSYPVVNYFNTPYPEDEYIG